MRTKTSLLEPIKKLNCLNDSGAAKLVKYVLLYEQKLV